MVTRTDVGTSGNKIVQRKFLVPDLGLMEQNARRAEKKFSELGIPSPPKDTEMDPLKQSSQHSTAGLTSQEYQDQTDYNMTVNRQPQQQGPGQHAPESSLLNQSLSAGGQIPNTGRYNEQRPGSSGLGNQQQWGPNQYTTTLGRPPTPKPVNVILPIPDDEPLIVTTPPGVNPITALQKALISDNPNIWVQARKPE